MPNFNSENPMPPQAREEVTMSPEQIGATHLGLLTQPRSATGGVDDIPALIARKVNPRFASRLKSRLSRL